MCPSSWQCNAAVLTHTGRGSCGAHEDRQTHEPAGTREHQGVLENGGGEVKNGREADCLAEEPQSKFFRAHFPQKSPGRRSLCHCSSAICV